MGYLKWDDTQGLAVPADRKTRGTGIQARSFRPTIAVRASSIRPSGAVRRLPAASAGHTSLHCAIAFDLPGGRARERERRYVRRWAARGASLFISVSIASTGGRTTYAGEDSETGAARRGGKLTTHHHVGLHKHDGGVEKHVEHQDDGSFTPIKKLLKTDGSSYSSWLLWQWFRFCVPCTKP
jgi:hypothetical protein